MEVSIKEIFNNVVGSNGRDMVSSYSSLPIIGKLKEDQTLEECCYNTDKCLGLGIIASNNLGFAIDCALKVLKLRDEVEEFAEKTYKDSLNISGLKEADVTHWSFDNEHNDYNKAMLSYEIFDVTLNWHLKDKKKIKSLLDEIYKNALDNFIEIVDKG